MKREHLIGSVVGILLCMPSVASAHQPRIVTGTFTEIKNPEVSQAFYGALRGTSVEYQIKAEQNFTLYAGILVPDIPNVRKDISVALYRMTSTGAQTIAVLRGDTFHWKPFYEEFAKDNYWWGPEYKKYLMPAGDYRIVVFSPSDQGAYVLVTGYVETFPLGEMLNALAVVPQLKMHFFNEPLVSVLASPFGWGLIALMYIAACVIGVIARLFIKRCPRRWYCRRLVLVGIGVGLLLLAIATTWHPLLLLCSGLALFFAAFRPRT